MFDEQTFHCSLDWLGSQELKALSDALKTEPPVSVRVNGSKFSEHDLPAPVQPVLWCNSGFYLSERPQFTLSPAFHGGGYYVQEASSMFVEWLVKAACKRIEGARILDMCAAPGGKTTLYSSLVGTEGVVVANEVVRQRANVLIENVSKWGLGNVIVTTNEPDKMSRLGELFDVVAVDAPCSGEGMFRKDPSAQQEWSPRMVAMCADRQRKILVQAWKLLKPGGVLIYSTCTFNRNENEDNVEWFASQVDYSTIETPSLPDTQIYRTFVDDIACYRFLPHRIKGEGFFVTAIRKESNESKHLSTNSKINGTDKKSVQILREYILQPETVCFNKFGDTYYALPQGVSKLLPLMEGINVIYSGIAMGQIFKDKLKPDHALALYTGLNRNAVNTTELDMDDTLGYLRGGRVDSTMFSDGINLVCYHGLPVGWANCIASSRVNNLYPKNLHIRH